MPRAAVCVYGGGGGGGGDAGVTRSACTELSMCVGVVGVWVMGVTHACVRVRVCGLNMTDRS